MRDPYFRSRTIPLDRMVNLIQEGKFFDTGYVPWSYEERPIYFRRNRRKRVYDKVNGKIVMRSLD